MTGLGRPAARTADVRFRRRHSGEASATALFVLACFGVGVAVGLFLLGLPIAAAVALAVSFLLFGARGERRSSSWRL